MSRRMFRSALVLICFLAFSSLGFAADVYAGERISKEILLKHFIGRTWVGVTSTGYHYEAKFEAMGRLVVSMGLQERFGIGRWKIDKRGALCTEFETSLTQYSWPGSCIYYKYIAVRPGIAGVDADTGEVKSGLEYSKGRESIFEMPDLYHKGSGDLKKSKYARGTQSPILKDAKKTQSPEFLRKFRNSKLYRIVGKGKNNFSDRVFRKYEKFKSDPESWLFAVTEDGQYAHWFLCSGDYCDNDYYDVESINNHMQEECTKIYAQMCFVAAFNENYDWNIFAEFQGKVLWDFDTKSAAQLAEEKKKFAESGPAGKVSILKIKIFEIQSEINNIESKKLEAATRCLSGSSSKCSLTNVLRSDSDIDRLRKQKRNLIDTKKQFEDPEVIKRQRLLAEAKQKVADEKRHLAEEVRRLGEREAKRRAEERKRKIAEARRAVEQEKALYEALASTAKVYLSHAQEFLSANPGASGLLDIITYMAGTKAALKERKGSTVKIALASLRATLSKEKGFSAFMANKTKEQQRRLAEEKRRAEAKHKRELAEAKRREEEKIRQRAAFVLNAKDDLKSYTDFLKRQIPQLVMAKPEMAQVMVYTIRLLEGGLSSNDLTVLEGLKSRAVLALKNHNLFGRYAEVQKMMAGARSAARKKAADNFHRMAAEKKARAAAVRQKNVPTKKTNPFADMHFGSYHALVIGNNQYRHLRHLKSARNDATAVTQLLTDQYDFRVSKLTDATRSDILGTLARYRATLKPDDNLLIYYAGHGVVDNVTEQGFWLPIDAEEQNPTNWISNSDLTGMLRAIRARHVMVVADSCYSGTLVRAASAQLRTAREKEKWIKRMLTKRGRTALVSGGLEPVSDSGVGRDHSVFAEAFLSALRENNNVMDGQALFDAIKRPVVLNADQTPQYSDIKRAGHEGGEFMFVRKMVR